MALPSQQAETCVLLTSVALNNDVLQLVIGAAEQAGYFVTSPEAEIAPGASLLATVEMAIQQAAVVLAIVDNSANPSTWFELGIAVAMSRPVLVVVTDDDVVLPSTAAGVRTVGPVLNTDLIARALRHAAKRATASTVALQTQYQTGVALGADADSLEKSLQALPRTAVAASSAAFKSGSAIFFNMRRFPSRGPRKSIAKTCLALTKMSTSRYLPTN